MSYTYKDKNTTRIDTYDVSGCCSFMHSGFNKMEYITFPALNNSNEAFIFSILSRYNLPYSKEDKKVILHYSEYPSKGLIYVAFSLIRLLHSKEYKDQKLFETFKDKYLEYDDLWIASFYISIKDRQNGYRWFYQNAASTNPIDYLNQVSQLYIKEANILSSYVPKQTSAKGSLDMTVEQIINEYQGKKNQYEIFLSKNRKLEVGQTVVIDFSDSDLIAKEVCNPSVKEGSFVIEDIIVKVKNILGVATEVYYARLSKTLILPTSFLS